MAAFIRVAERRFTRDDHEYPCPCGDWLANRFVNFIVRLVMLPVIAGISYEIIRFAGRHDNILTR